MKAATLFLAVGMAAAMVGSASAQTANPRAPYRKACQNDMKSFCPSTQGGRSMVMCLRANHDKLGSECQKALDQLPAQPTPGPAPAPAAPPQH